MTKFNVYAKVAYPVDYDDGYTTESIYFGVVEADSEYQLMYGSTFGQIKSIRYQLEEFVRSLGYDDLYDYYAEEIPEPVVVVYDPDHDNKSIQSLEGWV